jgi:hypothetical protein
MKTNPMRVVRADHAFHVLVRSGRTDAQVVKELAATSRKWIDAKVGTAR